MAETLAAALQRHISSDATFDAGDLQVRFDEASGVWKRGYGPATRTPSDESGGNRYAEPNATAPHPDSTSDLAPGNLPTEPDCQSFCVAIFRIRLHMLISSAISRELIHEPGGAYKLEAYDRAATRILAYNVGMGDDVL